MCCRHSCSLEPLYTRVDLELVLTCCLAYAEGVKAPFGTLLVCVLAVCARAQAPTSRVPQFEDYPVREIYKGTLAKPNITTPVQRRYPTRITQGVEKGWGVFRNGTEQRGPNFAGRMIVVQWGCGSPCLMMAMVDGVTGDIYSVPLATPDTLALPLLSIGYSVGGNPEITFRPDSRLMVIRATPDYFKEHHHSYVHYYLWQNSRWTLMYREGLDGLSNSPIAGP